eukprot:274554-Chlamydomonas_euryale.AAC.1
MARLLVHRSNGAPAGAQVKWARTAPSQHPCTASHTSAYTMACATLSQPRSTASMRSGEAYSPCSSHAVIFWQQFAARSASTCSPSLSGSVTGDAEEQLAASKLVEDKREIRVWNGNLVSPASLPCLKMSSPPPLSSELEPTPAHVPK